ncbi:MAG: AAA family ATPase [Patescibacteria group bacterium]|nr:AAA family ATPase [Patescibacteria group bacterium]
MFLKKIEITGFKSFAKKTTLDFSSSGVFNGGKDIGITAVVGPNGSGKSNIADAIRWAMGEQSMKTLRGKKAEDIIFVGSGKKAKLGSAQVSIYLDNSSKKLPLDFDEVVITRKIYRSGESEYIVNGSRVRLIDVVDLLAKAGVGQRSYCIINQGMADQILSATSVERRSMLEEAAGVKEYQVKKERSQRKLKSTKTNLERVRELLVEIEPHLRLLKRQSSKAQKGEQYRIEFKQKQHALFGFLWSDLTKAKDCLKEEKDEIGREMMKMQREVDDLIDKLKKESKNIVSFRDEIDKFEIEQSNLNHKINLIERNLVIEEGKMELEKEKAKDIEEIEVVQVGADMVKKRLSEIKTHQDELIKRITGVESLEALQELKEYAHVIAQEMYELYEAVVRGKMEKKKPQNEIEKQRTVNLKKVHEMMTRVKELKAQKEALVKQNDEVRNKINIAIKKDRHERKETIEFEDKLRRKQFELDKIKDKFNESKIGLVRVEVKEEDLLRRIQTEMNISPEKLLYKGQEVDASQFEHDINRLRFQLEQIGGIDDSIIEEFNETSKRYEFLKKELEDLEEAMKKLGAVVREMDAKIKDRFDEAYSHINKEFNKYFKIIFNGGKAKMNKVDVKIGGKTKKKDDENGEEDVVDEKGAEEKIETQVGIEILAEPPGKKITNLGMLSGGERALTSIAILFAIISHNPPPFAFLDEVEAALDEANSKRFGRILSEFSGQTQFVLITHNRETMKEAAVLYGVTMGDDGISKLLSVHLEQVGEEGEIKS